MKIIGMLPVFNDEDIISEVIEHLISQGIDNFSLFLPYLGIEFS